MALRQRRKRRTGVGRFIQRKAPWIDPFPHIPGTEPEKRIFAELHQRRYFFIFQGQVAAKPYFKPDFVLPEYKVIIDPFSPFHHSLEEAVARDSEKIAMYTALGYRYYHPWAIAPGIFLFDQNVWRRVVKEQTPYGPIYRLKKGEKLTGVKGSAADVINAIAELRRKPLDNLTPKQKRLKKFPGYELGPNVGLGANSVAAANRSRAKPKRVTLKRGTRRNKRGKSL
jgi:hypothetical protein